MENEQAVMAVDDGEYNDVDVDVDLDLDLDVNANDDADEDFEYSAGEEEEEEEEEEMDWEEVHTHGWSNENEATGGSDLEEDEAELKQHEDRDQEEDVADAVDWTQVNQELQREHDAAKRAAQRKPRARAVRMSRDDKARELVLHKTHLLVLLATQQRWQTLVAAPSSAPLRGLLLSLTSDSAFDFYDKMSTVPRKYALELLVRWFHQHFRVTSDGDSNDDGGDDGDDDPGDGNEAATSRLSEARLLDVFFARHGLEYELAVLFTVLCSTLGLRCRHCAALDPLVVQQHHQAFEDAAVSAAPRSSDRKSRKHGRADAMRGHTQPLREPFWIWTEVRDDVKDSGGSPRWITVDAIHKSVDHPQEIAVRRGQRAPLSYVIAIDMDGSVMDVTPRYVARWSKCVKLRLAHDWMKSTLDAVNGVTSNAKGTAQEHQDPDHQQQERQPREENSSRYVAMNREDERRLRDAERMTLENSTLSEAMPTSIEAFRGHHLYCLERHLARAEVIYPRKVIGTFRGYPVFHRNCVQPVRTTNQWRRLGRVINPDAVRTPAKRIGANSSLEEQAKSDGHNSAGDEGAGIESEPPQTESGTPRARALYGVWQTSEVVVPPVVNGVLPVNEYGNIEVWSAAHLPRGSVHLRLPRIAKLAAQLGLHYAPAVVGFELDNGKNCPVVDGIVVTEGVEGMLTDAHAHMQQQTIEKAIDTNRRVITKRWERLTKRLLLKHRLNEEYGYVE